MLYIVLALVLAAFGLLIAALTTAETLWAWISVVVSVAAAALLITDWVKGRRRRTEQPAESRRHRRDEFVAPDEDDELLPVEDDFPPAPPPMPLTFEPPVKAELPGGPEDERTVVTEAVEPPVQQVLAEQVEESVDYSADAIDEPGEEPTDASDLLVVAGLNVEVRVVDEHPRYHLATCVWLANRPTIPIPVSEARQLGFTPCARCGPDAILAARHRAAR